MTEMTYVTESSTLLYQSKLGHGKKGKSQAAFSIFRA